MAVLGFNAAALELLAAQYGVITRRQMLDAGHTIDEIRALLDAKIIEIVYRGVYRLVAGPKLPEADLVAAQERAMRDSVHTGVNVLALEGLEGFTIERAVLLVPLRRRISRVSFTVLDAPPPAPSTVRLIGPIRCVELERAFIDSYDVLQPSRWRAGWFAARRLGKVSERRLIELVEELVAHGYDAAARVAGELPRIHAKESEGEVNLDDAMAGYPGKLRWQAEVVPGRRVDAVDDEARIVFEYLGRLVHTTPDDVANDAVRELQLQAAGYIVVRVTKEMLADSVAFLASVTAIRTARLYALGA